MATNKNFEVKNGLTVAGTERISSAGAFSGSLASATTATTQSATDNSTKIATTAYTDAAITAVIGGAPGTLDTLNELAAAINDDASYASTLTTALATKAPLSNPTLTNITIPSANSDTVPRIRLDHPSVSGDASIDTFQDSSGTYLSIGSNSYQAANSALTKFNTNEEANALRFDSGGDIQFYSASSSQNLTERMRLTSSGKLGLGTTSPTYTMEIFGSGNTFLQITQSGDAVAGHLIGRASSKDLRIQNSENASTQLWTNNTERMRIDSSGKVGIGCTPARDLHLQTEGSTNGFRIQSNDENLVFLGAAGSSGSGVDDAYFALDSQGSNKIFMNTASTVGAVLDASSSTNSIRVPAGTTAQRPTGANGMIRYNTTDSKMEIYNGMWLPMKTEAPLSFQQASTYHQKFTIAADGQSAQAGSGYSAVTVNLNFEGNFILITKWHHTYMGVGIAYKAGITNANFTGESNDGAGPYCGGTTVDGFDNTVNFMGQYHWPIVGGGGNSILYYIKHQRVGNTISTHYSTNASSATSPSHSSWTQVQSATIASTDHCKPAWGEAHSGETVALTLLYNDITGGFNGS